MRTATAYGRRAAAAPPNAQAEELAETTVPADWGLIPTGLGPGDSFRLLFIGTNNRNANSSDIADYNTFVQNLVANNGHADIKALSATFRMLGSTEDVDARDNTGTTGTGVAIYWLGGAKVADDYADFYDGGWDEEATGSKRVRRFGDHWHQLEDLDGQRTRRYGSDERRRHTNKPRPGQFQQCLGHAGQPQQQYQRPRPHRERHERQDHHQTRLWPLGRVPCLRPAHRQQPAGVLQRRVLLGGREPDGRRHGDGRGPRRRGHGDLCRHRRRGPGVVPDRRGQRRSDLQATRPTTKTPPTPVGTTPIW